MHTVKRDFLWLLARVGLMAFVADVLGRGGQERGALHA